MEMMYFLVTVLSALAIHQVGGIEDTSIYRLTGGSSPYEGRLEISYGPNISQGVYHGVCSIYFKENDAKVVCRKLGFEGGKVLYPEETSFLPGATPIGAFDMIYDCLGHESSLFDCGVSFPSVFVCTGVMAVGVACDEAPTVAIQTTNIPTLPPCEYPVPINNVAQGKLAIQSSDKPRKDGGAQKAVDGNKNSDLLVGNSCTWTGKEFQPWWKVDLGQTFDIYEIRITNRADCCHFRIKNAEIRVGDSDNFAANPVCGRMVLGKMSIDIPIVIRCGCEYPMRGRYVSVQLIDREQMLTMCELEVMAG